MYQMTEGDDSRVAGSGFSRRRFLRAMAGAGAVAGAGLDNSGSVRAQDNSAGDEIWRFTEPSGRVRSSPTVVDGTVYVGSWDSNLYAVDAETGDEVWRFTEPLEGVYSSPTVVDDIVYVGSQDNNLYAVDSEIGDEVWRFTEPSGGVWPSPAVADGTVYVGSWDSNLYAVDAETGDEVWRFTEQSDYMVSSPTVVDGTVFVGSIDDSLYAVDAETGDESWRFTEPSDRVGSSPTVADGTVYVGSYDSNLYAVDAETGEEEWRFTEPSKDVYSSPTVAGSTVYVGSYDSNLYAVDAETGNGQWRFETSGRVRSSPTVADGTVYVGSQDNNLYAVDGDTGKEQWSHETDLDVNSSPTVVDGTVYVGSYDSNLYAVDAGVSGSSEGSRVTLGTLGHHNSFDEQGPMTPIVYDDWANPIPDPGMPDHGDGSGDMGMVLITGTVAAVGVVGYGGYRVLSSSNDEEEKSGYSVHEKTVSPSSSTSKIDEKLDGVRELIEKGKGELEANNFESALRHADYAVEKGETTLEEAEGASEKVGKAETVLGDARQLRQRVSEKKDYEDIEDELNEVESSLRAARERLNDRKPHAALERVENVPGLLEELRSLSEEKGFDELHKRTDSLEQRYDSIVTDTKAELQADTSNEPREGPKAPVESLSYDSIEKVGTVGSGGNADVYRAVADTPRGEIEFALKEPRMSGTLHSETAERLMQEAETWDKLDDHDHIVGIIDYDSEPLPWIAMEYMDAGHVAEVAGSMEFDRALWTAIATTEGVRHAHRRGVAHLDLKPENVLFRSVEDGWDVPKVADWGLSKHLLEHSKSIEGLSPQYSAPEQFDDDYGSTDDITDVYQLGAVFYELFTGQPTFDGKPAKVMNKVMNEEPTPPSRIADVPTELDDILLTAMAKDKTQRYESVLYLRDGLQNLYESV